MSTDEHIPFLNVIFSNPLLVIFVLVRFDLSMHIYNQYYTMYKQSRKTNPRVLRRAGDWRAAFPEVAVAALRGMVGMKAKLGETIAMKYRDGM